ANRCVSIPLPANASRFLTIPMACRWNFTSTKICLCGRCPVTYRHLPFTAITMTISALAQSLEPHRQLLVGFSGGLDSTVLLHQLVCWREQQPDVSLRAIHVHHGLSPLADEWVEHCQALCAQWQVPLSVVR